MFPRLLWYAGIFLSVIIATLSAEGQRIRQGVYRGMPVTYVIRNGKAIFQGDIVLEKVQPIAPGRPVAPAFGVAYQGYLWPKVGNQYQIPYVIQAGSADTTNLNAAISQFNSTFPDIQFVARTSETDYVNFYFNPGDLSGQCEAVVGRQGGEQTVGGSGSCTLVTILHEMGHTVGLWHEQSRPDRDNYVSVNYGNLIKGSISNFNKIYANAQTFGSYFDYASVMEYPAFSFSRNGGPAIESIPAGIPLSNYNGYTAADIDGIERLYGHAPTAVTVTSNPPGLQVIVDGVTVTTPQVYNWPLNSTHAVDVPVGLQSQSGVIVNSTQPATFYYNFARWNDSGAMSHSITVLPGNGEPASPPTSPAVTTYTANFVQLVPYSASVYPPGSGTVTPSPAPLSYSGSPLAFYTARQQVTLTATPASGQNFYEFNNAPFWLPGGLGANPKTFYVPDTGLTVNTTAEFSPNAVYTVDVSPNAFSSNLYIYADGNFWYAPKNFSSFYDSGWTAGSNHTLSLASPEYPYSSNSRYRFSTWSDGTTNLSDSIQLPSGSTTYSASLTPEFYVTDYAKEACGGSINASPMSPTGDGFYPAGDNLTFTETANTGWTFTGWQYDLAGSSSSQPLTVSDETLVTADYNTTAKPLTLTSLGPAAAVAGNAGFILTLNGTGFTKSTVVSVNGGFPAVKFINSMQLSVPVTAAQISTPGAFQVYVENFPKGAACAALAALPFTVAHAPLLAATPASISFPPQSLGTTSAATPVSFTNTSSNTLTNLAITTSGNYQLASNNCSSSLAAGASCSVGITFTPSISGTIAGSLTATDSAPDSPQIVALTGSGILPLTISPATLSFGTQTVGKTSSAKIVSVTNNQPSASNLSFTTSGNYGVNPTGTTCGSVLAANAKCNIAVTFTPTANGSINGVLTIADSTSFSPQLASLSGAGTGGGASPLTFTPPVLSFPPQVSGTASAAQTVTVKNASASGLTLSGIAASGDFSVNGNGTTPCAANLTLAMNATCTMAVTFAPALGTSATVSGAVFVSDNAPIAQQVLNTKGMATLPLSFSPTILTFPAQTVGTTSAPQTIKISNHLKAAVNLTLSGSGEYTTVPGGTTPCGSSLAGQGSCTVAVTFTPRSVGTRAGQLTVTDNANPAVETFSMTGTGQ